MSRLVVVWRVTEACTLTCSFCAYDRRIVRSRRDASPDAVRRFGRVLSAHQRERGEPALLVFLGGEPLGWGPLSALAAELHGELGLALGVTTNGTRLLVPGVQADLIERYAEVTISIDGIGATHDGLRGWPGGFAHLERGIAMLEAARRARGAGPLLRVNTVLLAGTITEFPSLCRILAGWGIDEITFNQLGGADRPEFYPANRLTPALASWLGDTIPPLQAELAAQGVRLSGGPDYLGRLAASARDERLAVADCAPGTRFLFVDEAGAIAPCSFTGASYGVPVTEVDSPAALAALPARFASSRAACRVAPCDDCHSTQVFAKFIPPPTGTARYSGS